MTCPLVAFEWAAARRSRVVPLFTAGFALVGTGVALAGLTAGGVMAVQGFARTSVSLLQLTLWTVPLLALLLGAVNGAECNELEFVVALPVSRSGVVFARWAAWTAALGAGLGVGFGAAGVVIGAFSGASDAWRYLALVGVAVLLLAAGLAIGLWIGVAASSRARAVGIAIVVWFVMVIGADILAIAVLSVLPRAAVWNLAILLLANPVDSARALGLGLFRADVMAGPTGAALRRLLGAPGMALLAIALIGWTMIPLRMAGRAFARQDL